MLELVQSVLEMTRAAESRRVVVELCGIITHDCVACSKVPDQQATG